MEISANIIFSTPSSVLREVVNKIVNKNKTNESMPLSINA